MRNETRPRLLFLCQTLPYPPDNGVQIRTYNVLRLLSDVFDITGLCFYRSNELAAQRILGEYETALGELMEVETFPIAQESSRVRYVWDHLRSLVTRKVYTEYAYESSQFRSRLLAHLNARHFDVVHVDSLDLAGYLPLLRDTPIVCVHHNVESLLLRRRAEAESMWLRNAYVRYQALLTERQERYWSGRVDLNVTVSAEDKAILSRLAPTGRYAVVPNGVDTHFFSPEGSGDDGVVFVGGNTWFPNRDALRFFAEAILPLLSKAGVTVPVRWVGRASEADRVSHAERYGIELTGYVDDIRPYVGRATCYIVPLRVGGGTRLKILDAWAMGKAVVSTSIGCEGLEAQDGHNILIRDTPQDFADAVCEVIRQPELRRKLGANARSTVESLYSWDVIGQPMIERYLDLIRQPRGITPVQIGTPKPVDW